MAQLINVRLSRVDGTPWGFRLQGGKDFGTPLVIQKVNGGSPAEKAGLIAGDSVIKVNTTEVFNLRHKDAQDVIVRAGPSFELTVQRGGSIWTPSVTPVGNIPRSQPVANNISPVTKTSLAAKSQGYTPIGSAHNLSPKGFSSAAPAPHMNGDGPKLVNKQYNTPIGLYSEQSIAETLSAQSEVLSTGAMGVNFKKNEKDYNAANSEVFKMLQEAEKEPKTPEPARNDYYSTLSHAVGGHPMSSCPNSPAPQQMQVRHPAEQGPRSAYETQENPICTECERVIVGVFVRIKDKNLHVECFKCATCGASLKNAGYYNINNKLYCDIHAKLAARNNPPAPNMVPVTVPPGGKLPVGTISAALASHSAPSLPSPSPLSPTGNQIAQPFQHSKQNSLDSNSSYEAPILRKEDAVANLMSALTLASQKEYKENGTNTEPVYFNEKIILINNNNHNPDQAVTDINTTIEQYASTPIKYMPYKPKSGGSNFSGPRPFSSVQPATPTHTPMAASLSNTLPRSASSTAMPERKEWPPSKSEDIPTATPLYIDPASRGPTPQLINPSPQNLLPQNPLPQNPTSQNMYSANVSLKTKSMETQQMEAFQSERSLMETSQMQNIQNALDHKMSICSAEVTNITGRRSAMECVETISESIDTQMLVNHLTKERPKSPPPIHRKDSVLDVGPQQVSAAHETQNISVLVTTNPKKEANPNVPIVQLDSSTNAPINIEDTVVTCTNPCPKNQTCSKNNPECKMKQSVSTEQSASNVQHVHNMQVLQESKTFNTVPQEYISPMVKALTVASDRPFSSVSLTIESKEFDRPKMEQREIATRTFTTSLKTDTAASETRKQTSKTESLSETQYPVMQAPPVVIQATSAPMFAPSIPYTEQAAVISQTKPEIKPEPSAETRFPHIQAPSAASPLASALTIAPSKPFTPIPGISMEPVPLPQESVPYFPPEHPVTIEPKTQKTGRGSTPFVQALTTAPDRPYTPIAAGKGQESKVPDFMKDVPPPPRQKMSMLEALTTTSDRPFTPALSVEEKPDIPFMPFVPPPPEPPKPVPKKIAVVPIAAKPASHIIPTIIPTASAFKPIGSGSKPFVPISQSYKPQPQQQIPVRNELQYQQSRLPEIQHSQPPRQAVPTYQQQSNIPTVIEPKMQYNVSQQSAFVSQKEDITTRQQMYQQQIHQQQMYQQPSRQTEMQYQQSSTIPTVVEPKMQYNASQQSTFLSQKEDVTMQEINKQHHIRSGLHAASNIPGYQRNLAQTSSEQLQQQAFVSQLPQPMQTMQPKQKPVTTLQPGQYQPNNVHATFQPVMDDQQKQYIKIGSPLPRAVSPSMINKPPPVIPYYQSDLVAHECLPVETNIFDPRSPAISRSPSPMPGARSSSPFPRTQAKSPAPGPPPNPLADRVPKQIVVKDEKYMEAKQNLTSYIPKYQGKVEQLKNKLTTQQNDQSYAQNVANQRQQQQIGNQYLQVDVTQAQVGSGQVQSTSQTKNYQNLQISQRAAQQQTQQYKMSEIENIHHMEQQNKSQMQSVETSANNRVQIQRTKRTTEEFERTQKSKVIELQKTGSALQTTQNISAVKASIPIASSSMQQTSQNIYSAGGTSMQQNYQPAMKQSFQSQNIPSAISASMKQNYQRQTSLAQQPPIMQPSTIASVPSSSPRSYSLPGAPASGPKPFQPSPLAGKPSSSGASRPSVSQSNAGAGTGRQAGAIGISPRRGRGILNLAASAGSRVPLCGHCNSYVRGPFITALGKIWCPEHFICTTPTCRRQLQDIGFVEERGQLYCEYCFEQYLAPNCAKCNSKIKGDCLNAIGKHFHPECFTCAYCSKLFGNSPFFLEDGLPYCEADWNELFTTKCFACGFPVEAGDRWVEALNNNYHSQCFNCTMCKKNLEGQSFYAKGGRPFCKNHAR